MTVAVLGSRAAREPWRSILPRRSEPRHSNLCISLGISYSKSMQIVSSHITYYHILIVCYCHHITSISCHLIFPKLSESNSKSFSQLQALELSKASNSSCSPVQSASQTNSTVPSKLTRPAAASAAASALP